MLLLVKLLTTERTERTEGTENTEQRASVHSLLSVVLAKTKKGDSYRSSNRKCLWCEQ